mgnify:CR=1 FL=1
MSHPNLAIPGNSSTATDTQFERAELLRNAEERAMRVFDSIGTSGVDAASMSFARTALTEAFLWAQNAVITPTRHTLPDDAE